MDQIRDLRRGLGLPPGEVPWASLFTKGVRLRLGRTDDRRHTRMLRDMILAGTARPGRIVTHHGELADAPALYAAFDQRREGFIKAVLQPA